MQDNRPKTQEELHQQVMRVLRNEFTNVAAARYLASVTYESDCSPVNGSHAVISMTHDQAPLSRSQLLVESQAAAVAIAMQLLGAGLATPSKFKRAIQELSKANLSSSVEMESGIVRVAGLVCLIPWQGTGDYVCEYDIAYVNSKEHDAIGRALRILNETEDQ